MTADHIRFIRSQLGLTQAQLANTLGVTVTTVARWEQGHVAPTGINLTRLQRMYSTASFTDADAYATGQRQQADDIGKRAYDAHYHAERSGLSPLAAFLGGSAATAHSFGDTEQQWVLARGSLSSEKLATVIEELKSAGLWPWG